MALAHTTETVIDDKTRKLFLKLRKGADASLSFPQLFKVLGMLGGWTVEEIVALTSFHYVYEGKPVLEDICIEGETTALKAYALFTARVVAELPAAPVMGESYVMGLEPFGPMSHYNGNHFGAKFQLWVGTPGYRITAPTGEQFEIAPSRHDFTGQFHGLAAPPVVDVKVLKRRLRHWDAMRWLKGETSYLAQINTLLGMEEHVPAAQRTRENTGTCPCCFRNIKLDREHLIGADHPSMALHGYQRPGDGEIRGRCTSSAGFAPYELSPEGTVAERDLAEQRLARCVTALDRIREPGITEFTVHRFMLESIVHRKSDADWARQLGYAIDSAKREVDRAEAEHAIYAWLVANWTLRELPTAGSKEPIYWTAAARAVAAAQRDAK